MEGTETKREEIRRRLREMREAGAVFVASITGFLNMELTETEAEQMLDDVEDELDEEEEEDHES